MIGFNFSPAQVEALGAAPEPPGLSERQWELLERERELLERELELLERERELNELRDRFIELSEERYRQMAELRGSLNILHLSFDHIAPGELIRIAEIELYDDIEYEIHIYSETVGAFFAGAIKDGDIMTLSGSPWYLGNLTLSPGYEVSHTLSNAGVAARNVQEGSFYVYIGSPSDGLRNVTVTLSTFHPNGRINHSPPGDGTASDGAYIAEIAPGEAFPVAKVVMGGDNSYIVEVTSESGSGFRIYSGLRREYAERVSQSGQWYFYTTYMYGYEGPYINTIPSAGRDVNLDGEYYLYVGNHSGELLTGVKVSVIESGSTAATEFLPR